MAKTGKLSMTCQISNLSENKIESTVDKFRNALVAWLSQKQTGKLIFEVDTGQGGVSGCHLKTDAKI